MSGPRNISKGRARACRGMGLFDALIAMAILTFGLLALTRFQTRLVAQTSETQARQVATQYAAEHLSTLLVDHKNIACYTVPATGTCADSAAAVRSANWAASAAAALPAPASAAAQITGNQIKVTIFWQGKDSGEPRRLEATSDIRFTR